MWDEKGVKDDSTGFGLDSEKGDVILPKWGSLQGEQIWDENQESAFGLTKFELFVTHPGDVEAFGVWSPRQIQAGD